MKRVKTITAFLIAAVGASAANATDCALTASRQFPAGHSAAGKTPAELRSESHMVWTFTYGSKTTELESGPEKERVGDFGNYYANDRGQGEDMCRTRASATAQRMNSGQHPN